jgi:hypothetical protein
VRSFAVRDRDSELKVSFAAFLRDKAHVWTGLDTTEYKEVERHRALESLPGYQQGPAQSPDEIGMDGEEEKVLGRKVKGYPDFGHNMKQYFKFDKDCKHARSEAGAYGLTLCRRQHEPWCAL